MGMIAKAHIAAGEHSVLTEEAVKGLIGQKTKVMMLGRSTDGIVESIAHRYLDDQGRIVAVDVIVQMS